MFTNKERIIRLKTISKLPNYFLYLKREISQNLFYKEQPCLLEK